jgi:alpha-D-xyloside xylohydrolase
MSRAITEFDPIVAATGWALAGTAAEVVLSLRTAGGKTVSLTARAISPRTWKISLVPEGVPAPTPSPMVLDAAAKSTRLAARPVDGGLEVTGPELRLEIRFGPFAWRFVDRSGRVVIANNAGDVDGLGRPAFPALAVRVTPEGGSVAASFHLRPDERLYGLGEKFTRLEKSGQRVVSWTVDALGSTSERSHKNVPFLWTNRGAGVFLDTGARIAWDLGAASLQTWSFEANTPALDIYVIHGPEPAQIMAAYTALTGRAPAVPAWSFGLWFSSGGTYRDQASIEALLDGIERHRLPADVVHIDPWWMRWRQYCDFAWDREAFPDPDGLIRRIHGLGLKLCLWEHPYVSVESALFETGKERGFFALKPDGEVSVIDYGLSLAPRPDGRVRVAGGSENWNAPVAIIDLTDPKARAWFQDLHRPLLRQGVDVFKTDFGEDVPADARFHDGRTGAEIHNLYPLLYNAAVFEVTAQEKGCGLVWARSGTAGSQRFPVCWSGDPASDWDSLAATIRGGLSAGLSGLPLWSHDIGGYRGTPDPELYVRWAQFGLFSSHSRMHGDSPREPWLFGAEALSIFRKFAELRYRLFPYVRGAALEAAETGLPVLRALPLAFPDDLNAPAWEHQYLFGPSFLAAPVIRPAEELVSSYGGTLKAPKMPVYLPAGCWVDYWTGRRHEGPGVVVTPARLDVMPLFVRAGAVIPMTEKARRIPEGLIDPLELEIYPDPAGPSGAVLIEEEGHTFFSLTPQTRGRFVFDWQGPLQRSHVIRSGRGAELSRAGLLASGRPLRLAVAARSVFVRDAAPSGKIRLTFSGK